MGRLCLGYSAILGDSAQIRRRISPVLFRIMSGSQTPGAASPATNSLTPMELDVNAATTPEQQQQLQRTPSGSTEFQNPNQVPPGIVKQEGASFNPLNNPLFAVPAPAASSTATATAPVNQPDVELNRREKTLAEFLAMMDNYAPIVRNIVFSFFLKSLLTNIS